jgi:hypothetical protein
VQGMFENFSTDGLFFPVMSFSAGVKWVTAVISWNVAGSPPPSWAEELLFSFGASVSWTTFPQESDGVSARGSQSCFLSRCLLQGT